MRARVVYASKERVKQNAITYEELADPKWKGKICIRSGQHIYNNALFAAYIAQHGEAKAEEWLKGVKANLAQKPSGGDRETARDIAAGKCDIGIGNTYYWALMNNKEPDKKAWADATKVILPTFQGDGTHVNLSGVLLTRNAPNKANALKLIEWLAGEKAQQMYADMNYEYPVRAGIADQPDHRGLRPAQARLRCRSSKIADNEEGGGQPGRQGRLRQVTATHRVSDTFARPTKAAGQPDPRPSPIAERSDDFACSAPAGAATMSQVSVEVPFGDQDVAPRRSDVTPYRGSACRRRRRGSPLRRRCWRSRRSSAWS